MESFQHRRDKNKLKVDKNKLKVGKNNVVGNKIMQAK